MSITGPGKKIMNAIDTYYEAHKDYPSQAEVARMIGHHRGYVALYVKKELVPKGFVRIDQTEIIIPIKKKVNKLISIK